MPHSVFQQSGRFADQVFDLRKGGVLQVRVIADPGVEESDAAHRGVEPVKQFIGDWVLDETLSHKTTGGPSTGPVLS
jgi:hypothetical protein